MQSFSVAKLLLFAQKQLRLAEKVYAVYEAGPLGYVLYRKLKELGGRFKQRPSRSRGSFVSSNVRNLRLMLIHWDPDVCVVAAILLQRTDPPRLREK